MINMISAHTKWDRTNNMTKANWKRLLTMKWLPTDAAALTCSTSSLNRWRTYPIWRMKRNSLRLCVNTVSFGILSDRIIPIKWSNESIHSKWSVVYLILLPNGMTPTVLVILRCVEVVVKGDHYHQQPGYNCAYFICPDCLKWMGISSREWIRCVPCR